MVIRILISACLSISPLAILAQNRITDQNDIFWLPLTVNAKINNKMVFNTEYQWRRNQLGVTWQQSLLRFGVTYNLNKVTSFQGGYAWVLTYPYGDYPIAANGTFTEHRTHQQVMFKPELNANGVNLFTRLRLEQRWLEVLNADKSFNHWNYLNRIRIMQRLNIPLKLKKQSCYFSLVDELFVGFGENVGLNVFDQNRIYALAGWNVSKSVQLEFGALNQILQQGKAVNGKSVFQYNTGPVLGCNVKL
jgi:hypothetical protein